MAALMGELVGRRVTVVSMGPLPPPDPYAPQTFVGILGAFDEEWIRIDSDACSWYVPVATIRYIEPSNER